MINLPDSQYDYRHENKSAKKLHTCSICGYGIYNGDVYFQVDDKAICEECMQHLKCEAEEG